MNSPEHSCLARRKFTRTFVLFEQKLSECTGEFLEIHRCTLCGELWLMRFRHDRKRDNLMLKLDEAINYLTDIRAALKMNKPLAVYRPFPFRF